MTYYIDRMERKFALDKKFNNHILNFILLNHKLMFI